MIGGRPFSRVRSSPRRVPSNRRSKSRRSVLERERIGRTREGMARGPASLKRGLVIRVSEEFSGDPIRSGKGYLQPPCLLGGLFFGRSSSTWRARSPARLRCGCQGASLTGADRRIHHKTAQASSDQEALAGGKPVLFGLSRATTKRFRVPDPQRVWRGGARSPSGGSTRPCCL